MKLTLDTQAGTLTLEDQRGVDMMSLYSDRAFKLLSEQWLCVGWVQKHAQSYAWFDRPLRRLPEDALRLQEAICRVQPTLIVEVGVKEGGGLLFDASVAAGAGLSTRLIGVEDGIEKDVRKALTKHPLGERLTLIDGAPTAKSTLAEVKDEIKKGDRVMVVLDADHEAEMVLELLRAYSKFVSKGGYLVSTGGLRAQLAGLPRAGSDWATNNPAAANEIFASENNKFEIETPAAPFNDGTLDFAVSEWSKCWLRRVR